MQITQKKTTIRIDASGRTLGRVASEAAKILSGKVRPNYRGNAPEPVAVEIVNVSLLEFSRKKTATKSYARYSGYPGGLRFASYRELLAKKPDAALRHAISGMLARNKLRVGHMKRLAIYQHGVPGK